VAPKITKDGRRPVGSEWMRYKDIHGYFCSMRCAAEYGIKIADLINKGKK